MSDEVENPYFMDESDIPHSIDAVKILNRWMQWTKTSSRAHQLAARILSEIVAESEVTHCASRCDVCGGGAALFEFASPSWISLTISQGDFPTRCCLWCVAEKETHRIKEVA